MAEMFDYQVDGETVRACLALIEKHASKAANVTGPAPMRRVRTRSENPGDAAAGKLSRRITGEELNRLKALVGTGRRVADIAREWGWSYTSTLLCLRRLGFSTKSQSRVRHGERVAKAVTLRSRGYGLAVIARTLGVSVSTAWQLVREGKAA